MNEILKLINDTIFYRYYPTTSSPFEVSIDTDNKYGKGIYFLDNPYYYQDKFKDGMVIKIKPNLKNPKFYTEGDSTTPNSEYASDIIKSLKENIKTRNEFTNELIKQGYDSIVAVEPRGTYLIMFYNDPDNYTIISDKKNVMAVGGEIKPLNFVSDDIVSSIQDLITEGDYGNLNKEEALFFYNKFKGKEQKQGVFLSKDGIDKKIISELIEQGYIDESWLVNYDSDNIDDFDADDSNYSATDTGIKFLNAIEGRVKTRVGMKEGTDLFPENSNVKEYENRVSSTKDKLSKLISIIPENKSDTNVADTETILKSIKDNRKELKKEELVEVKDTLTEEQRKEWNKNHSRRIGFAGTYYTIWDISSDTIYNQDGTGYHTVYFNYIQNLSKDLDKAIEKAIEMNATSLEVDTELYGRNRSFKYREKIIDIDKVKDERLLYIAYISNSREYTPEIKKQAFDRMLADGMMIDYNGEFYHKIFDKERLEYAISDFNHAKKINDFVSIGHYEIITESNLKMSEFPYLLVNGVAVHFKDYKVMDYQGFTYGLPLIDGKAKKIKGKKISFDVKMDEEYNIILGYNLKIID